VTPILVNIAGITLVIVRTAIAIYIKGVKGRLMPYSVEAPFVIIGNRQALTFEQLFEHQWLLDFVRRFPNCFERHPGGFAAYVFWPDGDSPHPVKVSSWT
jgi:hypothetical protein